MKSLINILLLLLMVAAWSCKKEPSPGDCFKPTGSIITEDREIGAFNNVILKDNINLFLKNGAANSISVEAGENLLSKIKTIVNENGDLVISNKNRCNWVRSYQYPVNVYLDFAKIDTLFYASIGDVVNQEGADTLWFGDKFCVQIDGGSGDLRLNLITSFLRVIFSYGTCDVECSGHTKIVSVFSAAWGRIDLTQVYSPKVWAINNSSNDMYLYSSEELVAKIKGLGNIYVSGNPSDISFRKEGEGNLIFTP